MFKIHFLRFQGRVAVIAAALACAVALGGLAAGCAKQALPQAEREAEAKRLYERADLYVRKIAEGTYSYEYINFHYLHAMANVDRVLTAFPDTEYGRKLKDGELKLGNFTIDYFRNTLLAQLGDMKEATESVVNCAIYLHTLPEADKNETRAALGLILETLCRLVRSDEALIFPVVPENALFARETIVRVMTRDLQKDVALSLVQGAEPGEQPFLAAAYGEGMAVGGLKLDDLNDWSNLYPTPEKRVELGIFRGMVQRESNIYRDKFDKVKQKREEDARKAAAAKVTVGETPKPLEEAVRYDVAAYYQEKFGSVKNAEAAGIFAGFKALQGNMDDARALTAGLDEAGVVNVVANYYEGLGLTGKLTGHEDLHTQLHLSPDAVAHCELKLVEFLSQNAKYAEADAVKDAGTKEFPAYHDQFIRSRMYGVFYSRTELFYLNAKTIPNLGIKDPAVCAEVLLDWFLSPNKLYSSSWGADQILFKYFSIQREGRPISRKLIKS
jgi:hypothetical protein